MDKKELLSEIDRTIFYIETVIKKENKKSLIVFVNDLDKLKAKVIANEVNRNPLKGFARRYAEIYSDYLHPITDILYKAEKSVDLYLDNKS